METPNQRCESPLKAYPFSVTKNKTKRMKSNTYVPLNGHIPEAVVVEVLEDLKSGKTYRQISDDYAVSLGWISKVKRGLIRRNQ